MSLAVEAAIEAEPWSRFEGLAGFAAGVIAAAAKESGVSLRPGAEVSALFCDDAFIRKLNREWRGIDRPTNVLAFPAAGRAEKRGRPQDSPALLGDIVIAYETAAAEAAAAGLPLRDHTAHLLVHGFLHLLGYDHEEPAGAEAMEAVERAVLASLGIADPYRLALIEEASCINE
jgi:probable rRNA maturation factor